MLKIQYLPAILLALGVSGCVSVTVERDGKKKSAPPPSEIVAQPLMTGSAISPQKTLVEHKIVSGDSLWKIARQYETSVAEIKAANQMQSDVIIAGQTILVPTTKVPEGAVTSDGAGIFESPAVSSSKPAMPPPPVIIPPVTSS